MVGPGTTVIADNIISPGVPELLEYVETSPEETIAKAQREQSVLSSDEHNDISLGDPNSVYGNTLMDSFGPTGEPCEGVLIDQM